MIELEGVRFRYPKGPEVIKGVTLSIEDGEFVGLIGHSGVGKTTLAKLIAGLLKPNEGRVLVDGIDTRVAPASVLARKVGYVFQNPETMLFSATLLEEVAFALKNFGYPPDELEWRVHAALEKVDLRKPLNASPHALSFGEKRRLAIACVLAMDPSVLVLDEPTTGLDYARCLSLFHALSKLNDEGKTVIVITHDTDLLARFADRVIVLEGGVVVRDGPAREVLSDTDFLRAHGFTPTQLQILAARLKAPAPTADAVAETLAGVWASGKR